jgi:hypothetical protein
MKKIIAKTQRRKEKLVHVYLPNNLSSILCVFAIIFELLRSSKEKGVIFARHLLTIAFSPS